MPGRPRLAAGRDRPGGDLDHLPVPERPLPLGRQPHQPDAADHRRRPDLDRHRASCCCSARSTSRSARSAAWRPRCMAVLNVQHGWNPLPCDRRGHRRRACRSAPFRASSSAVRRALLRGDLGGPARLAGSPVTGARVHAGTINLTDPAITGLANTFYSDAVGWIMAAIVIVAYGALTLLGHRRRLAAESAKAEGMITLAIASSWWLWRRSSSSPSSTPTAACRSPC